MIDVHCHFDLVANPERYISENERKKIITIGMTNLPSHFQMGFNRVRTYKHIRLALGLHPLLAQQHSKEYSRFKKFVDNTSYIGEVGLDFSEKGIGTKDIQLKSFKLVLDCIKEENKIVSLHSRRAEEETLEMLLYNKIKNAIFHWYSGPLNILKKIIDSKYFFSINSAMIKSNNGRKIISQIPKELILTETDNPFIENSDIDLVHKYLSSKWDISETETEKIISQNFKRLLINIK